MLCRFFAGKSRLFRGFLITVLVVAATALVFAVTVLAINFIVVGQTVDNVFLSVEKLPQESFDCILILGAGLQRDGSPSHMLEDRIKTGVAVFNEIDAEFILMSGDRSGDHYDEPAAMKKYALELGVDEESILIDEKGFSTFESIERAKEIYGFDSIVVITQEYHLYRALYISEAQGLDAVGVSADLRQYRGQIYREIREILARVKDYIKS